jgi:mRNA interferase MazF
MEQTKDFDGWNLYKQRLQLSEPTAYFQVRDVWWCSIGVNVGSEQDGHHERYERPVLILRGFSRQLFWGVPISSKLKPTNRYYLKFEHESQSYSALISQLRLFDSKRLVRKLYTLPNARFSEIQHAIIREVATATTKTDSRRESPRIPKEL